jgi:hypothetical protein
VVVVPYSVLLIDLQAKTEWAGLGSDPLHLISAKLIRRIIKFEKTKLGSCLQHGWIDRVSENARLVHDLLVEKLRDIEASVSDSNTSNILRKLRPAEELNISLPHLDVSLPGIKSRGRSAKSYTFKPSSIFPKCLPSALPTRLADPSGTTEHKYYRLAALEAWVEKNQHSWVDTHKKDTTTCGSLRELMNIYHKTASVVYNSDFGHVSSFAVNFFDVSPDLQELKSGIESDASEKREEKLQELATLKLEYQGLMVRYDKGTCDTRTTVVDDGDDGERGTYSYTGFLL